MILHGLCPAALIRRPRLFSPSRKLLTKDLVPRVFQDARVFFRPEKGIKKTARYGGWSMQGMNFFNCY